MLSVHGGVGGSDGDSITIHINWYNPHNRISIRETEMLLLQLHNHRIRRQRDIEPVRAESGERTAESLEKYLDVARGIIRTVIWSLNQFQLQRTKKIKRVVKAN